MNERDGFDKVSFELGRQNNALETLKDAFKQHELDDDRRHVENVNLLTANNEKIDRLTEQLAPIAASHALNRRRLALLASVGLSILVMVSWGVEAALKWLVDWLLKAKLGG